MAVGYEEGGPKMGRLVAAEFVHESAAVEAAGAPAGVLAGKL